MAGCGTSWLLQAFKLQSLKEATTTQGFLAALELLIATPDADKGAVVQAALKCKREHKVSMIVSKQGVRGHLLDHIDLRTHALLSRGIHYARTGWSGCLCDVCVAPGVVRLRRSGQQRCRRSWVSSWRRKPSLSQPLQPLPQPHQHCPLLHHGRSVTHQPLHRWLWHSNHP